jgi:hypothetical protein
MNNGKDNCFTKNHYDNVLNENAPIGRRGISRVSWRHVHIAQVDKPIVTLHEKKRNFFMRCYV